MKLGLGIFNTLKASLPSYVIVITADPVGGGTPTGAGTYKKGETVQLHAAPGETYSFVNWTENGTPVSVDPDYSFSATADRTLVAHYALIQYTIGVSGDPVGGGTPTGGGTYTKNSTVNLHASPGATYNFVNWTELGVEVSTNADYSFTATANRTLVAHYSLIQYTISISVDPPGSGSTTGAGTYTKNDPVSVDADFAAGYGFVNWTEGGVPVSTDATYNFTATANRTLVANFELVPPAGTHWGYALDLNGADEYLRDTRNWGVQLATNGSFVDWTGGVPNSWTRVGTQNGSDYIEESPADSLHIVSSGPAMGVQMTILTIGKRYRVVVDVPTVTSGSIKIQMGSSGSSTVISTTGTKVFDLYCDGTDGVLFLVRNAACNAVVASIEVYEYLPCLDLVSQTNQITSFNNSGMEQATNFAWATGGNHAASRTASNPKWGAYTVRATVTGTGDGTTNNISLPSGSITALTSGNQYAFSFFIYSDTASRTVNWSIGDKTGSMSLPSATTWYFVRGTFTAAAGTVNQPIRVWITGGSCSVYLDSIKIQPKYDMAISAWFKRSGVQADNGMIFSALNDNGGVDRFGFDLGFYNTGNDLYFELLRGSSYDQVSTIVNDTNWHLVTVTYVGTTLTMYLDGVSVATQANVLIGDEAWKNFIRIGEDEYGGGTFTGLIGEIQVVRFNALGSSDFDATLYHDAGIPKTYAGGTPVIDIHFKWAGASDALMLANAGVLTTTLVGTNVTQAGDQVLTDKTPYITRD